MPLYRPLFHVISFLLIGWTLALWARVSDGRLKESFVKVATIDVPSGYELTDNLTDGFAHLFVHEALVTPSGFAPDSAALFCDNCCDLGVDQACSPFPPARRFLLFFLLVSAALWTPDRHQCPLTFLRLLYSLLKSLRPFVRVLSFMSRHNR